MKVSVLEVQKDGQEVAKLVASKKVLPDLSEFRASIKLEGEPMSQTVIQMRDEGNY
jgi:hypothetical protein